MQVTLSYRRCELILRGLDALIERYKGPLSLNPRNKELLAAVEELQSLRAVVAARLEPLPELESIEI